jgi:hypothetical protein
VRRCGTSSKLILAAIALAIRCEACIIACVPIDVGPDFQVKVENPGGLVKGLRLELAQGQENDQQAVTDNSGFAVFRGIRPGSYSLGVSHQAEISSQQCIEVKRSSPREITVPLTWPSKAPIPLRSFKGELHFSRDRPGQPQLSRSLDLLDGISGVRLKRAQTNGNGEFNFEDVKPGFYLLSINPLGPGGSDTGVIAVVVDPAAPADHLDLDLGWTDCGLMYSDRSKCPRGDLKIEELSGWVTDVTGAAIPAAEILLTDPANTLAEQLKSDTEGRFASPHSFAGTYELIVRSPGFVPLRVTLHIATSMLPKRPSSLNVQLGIVGRL